MVLPASASEREGAGRSQLQSFVCPPQYTVSFNNDSDGSGSSQTIRRVQSEITFEHLHASSAGTGTGSYGYAAMGSLGYSPNLHMLTSKLRELQLEVGRLNRKLQYEAHEKARPVVLSRRAALTSTLLLGILTFFSRSVQYFNERRRVTGLSKKLFVPDSLTNKNSIISYTYDAIVGGMTSSIPFFVSFGFLRSDKGKFDWKSIYM